MTAAGALSTGDARNLPPTALESRAPVSGNTVLVSMRMPSPIPAATPFVR
jgi:hypothetical protein